MEYLQPENLIRYVEILAMVIAACAAIAAATPTKIDDKLVAKLGVVYNIVSKLVNTVGLNVGKAKNADELPNPHMGSKQPEQEEHA